MGTPQTKRFLEPTALLIGVGFPFDKDSPELLQIKRALLFGISVAMDPADLPEGDGEKNNPDVVVSFFVVNGAEYQRVMRVTHGNLVTEIPHESVMQLGAVSPGAKRIMAALAAECSVCLIPERGGGVSGRYTLCVVSA